MAKAKLSELVAKLEDDFEYQYNYNQDVIRDNHHLYAELKGTEKVLSNITKSYVDAQKSANRWCSAFLFTWFLIIATITSWLMFCPVQPEIVKDAIQTTKDFLK